MDVVRTDNEETPVATTPLTSTDVRWNNVGYWSFDAARRHPGKVALIDLSQDTPREVSFRQLEERLNRVASLLTRLGLAPGERIAMSVTNRFEFIEIMFGAMRAGIVPVPLNIKLGPDTIEYIVRDAGCVGAVVEHAAHPRVAGIVEKIGARVRVAFEPAHNGWLNYDDELAASEAEFRPPALSENHVAFLPYTSGSTGRPKGVPLTHAGQCWWIRCLQKYWPAPPDSRALTAVPLYHKNAMAGAIKPLLSQGGSAVILPDFKPRRFLDALSQYRCTQAGGVPAVYTLLLQERDLIANLDFSALKKLTIGSAPTPKELLAAVQTAFGVPVIETYGLTEGGPVMIGSPLDGRAIPPGSCGVAWPEGEVKLVSADGEEGGTYGELWVKNPGVTPGYYNLPQVDRERFRDGWLKTGDVFSRDSEGFFYFRGRTDDMFNSGGENVYPLEVENLLLRHPVVAEVSVVPVPHRVKGEVPVAMVVKAKGRDVSADELQQFCLAHGPAYAHPRRIVFVSEMPLNGPGKIDRKVVQRDMLERFGTLG